MDGYVDTLLASTLPLGPWALAVLWVAFLLSSYALLLWGQRLRSSQVFISFPAGMLPSLSVRLFALRLVVGLVVFGAAALAGREGSVFVAGGWCIAGAVALSSNVRSLLFFRALSGANSASGRIDYTVRLALINQVGELFAAALLCLLLGLLLPHLALLGAAFVLGATALGFLRKSLAAPARP
jgi:hypothetical protein